ncbi:MAG TPA: hypothetical protein VGP24_09180 [Glaciihabitans sp.]|nr:hypothetical protein [Glaciihabitans sp.]
MTATLSLAKHSAAAPSVRDAVEVRWTTPEAKLWVATQGDDFAGFVEFSDGHYEVTDGRGVQLAARATLREAKASLALPHEQPAKPMTLLYVAVATGGLALSLFIASLAIVWMG